MELNSVTFALTVTLLFLSINLQAYTPVDRFTISCGTSGKSSDGERTWTGDRDSNLLSRQDGTVSANATTQSLFINQVPYATARFSRSQFNYSFPVTAGPKFVRLFFYPTSYHSFTRSDASFTVQANQFTLLRGFNASLNADAQSCMKTIFKEYVINVDSGDRLNLSFTPSHSNSYAFINGIEVLSMPSDLYYTPENDFGFTLVGSGALYDVKTNTALETVYRFQMGAAVGIPPQNDTGLFRNWPGYDTDYYLALLPIRIPVYRNCAGLNITVNPDYVAPKELYRTAAPLLRASPLVDDISDRVFFIFINGELADGRADVMRWNQKQKGLAVQKNYAVLIPKNNTRKKVNLKLQLHPHESNRFTRIHDPFLNGLEIFKISHLRSNNLAGPNPDPLQTPKSTDAVTVESRKSSGGGARETNIIGVVAGVISGVFLISLVVFLVVFFQRKRITKSSATSKCLPLLVKRDIDELMMCLPKNQVACLLHWQMKTSARIMCCERLRRSLTISDWRVYNPQS
ncbi:hypothetical protein Fmac_016635 [Flemingia macrophylla]|uniref:Malectin-like domain-containing protein n=1 Tax=Flemingia macrophylla TaxID=520843 RepID=A0ABD1MI17_9FABA